MNKTPLYKDKKVTNWTINRVAEVLYSEWKTLNPQLEKNVAIYGKKTTLISFNGEVNVALEITKQRFPEKDFLEMYFEISLSPILYDLNTHVLNTLDMGVFIEIFPELKDERCFTLAKSEPWNGSLFAKAAQVMRTIIEIMLNFESCFHFLLDDEYKLNGSKLDSKSLSLTHHLNQVKAYRLAEIYGHPEKLDEAIKAIKRYAQIDELSHQRLEKLCTAKSAGGMDWLYTPEMIERLGKHMEFPMGSRNHTFPIRSEALDMERYLTEKNPGPLNRERWLQR